MKKFIIFLFMLLVSITTSFASELELNQSQLGVVKSVTYVEVEEDVAQAKQLVDVQLLQGSLKGNLVQVENLQIGNPYYDIKVKKGMKVLLHLEETDEGLVVSIEDVYRSSVLLILSCIFGVLLLYIGRKKGFYSLVSILITCFLILKFLSPLILCGFNPVFATMLICLLATIVTMYLVGGFNKKSTSAIIGCMLSIVAAGLLAVLTTKIAFLTGFNDEQSVFLYSAHPELNFITIAISMMLLATLGAVMDVAMSIASTINEIFVIDNTKTVRELFLSGMNVGRDIIGTMANTLILVYLGASLPLVLLASNVNIQKFLNLNQVVTEISSALIGSIAIVICVPLTAFITSNLVRYNVEKKENLSI